MLVHYICFIFNDIHVIVFDLCIDVELDCILRHHHPPLRQAFVTIRLYGSKVSDVLLLLFRLSYCPLVVKTELVAAVVTIKVIVPWILHLS